MEKTRSGKTPKELETRLANEEGCRHRGNNNGEDFPPAVFMIKQIKQDRKAPQKKGVMIYG